MGDCYSATLSVKFKRNGEKNAVKALNKYITDNDGKGTNFSLAAYKEKTGFTPDNWDGLVHIFLADWDKNRYFFDSEETERTGYLTYRNGFDCSYGWGSVLYDFAEIIAPFLANGSYVSVDSDETNFELSVEDGEWQIADTKQEFAEDRADAITRDTTTAILSRFGNRIVNIKGTPIENGDGEWCMDIEIAFKKRPTDKDIATIREIIENQTDACAFVHRVDEPNMLLATSEILF